MTDLTLLVLSAQQSWCAAYVNPSVNNSTLAQDLQDELISKSFSGREGRGLYTKLLLLYLNPALHLIS